MNLIKRQSYSSLGLVFNEGGCLVNDPICKEPNNSTGVVRCFSFSSYKYPDYNHAKANNVFLSFAFWLLPVLLYNATQTRFQVFKQGLSSWGPSTRRSSSTGSFVTDDVAEDINTHPTLVIAFGPVLQVFAEPDPELHIGVQIQRVVKVGEDQLFRMFIVHHRHGVPQSRSVLYKLLQGKYHVVVSVGYDDVQRVYLKGAVTMVTPATVVGTSARRFCKQASAYRLTCLVLLGMPRDLGGCFWPRSKRDGSLGWFYTMHLHLWKNLSNNLRFIISSSWDIRSCNILLVFINLGGYGDIFNIKILCNRSY